MTEADLDLALADLLAGKDAHLIVEAKSVCVACGKCPNPIVFREDPKNAIAQAPRVLDSPQRSHGSERPEHIQTSWSLASAAQTLLSCYVTAHGQLGLFACEIRAKPVGTR
jgi:hypothetical protein